MTIRKIRLLAGVAALAVIVGVVSHAVIAQNVGHSKNQAGVVPVFEVDLSWQWPPKLPNNWVVGIISFVAVDRHDHVWILQRYRQLAPELSSRAAPPVLEFDENQQFVQAWGGPGEGSE